MTDLTPFNFDGQAVRVVTIDGEPWFVATDVARILDYRDANRIVRRLDPEDVGTHNVGTPSGVQPVSIINESGLYEAILYSRTPGAKRFKKWVTTDVLPAIRKTGQYGTTPALTGAELLATAVIEADRMIREKDATIAVLTPRAEAWDVMASASGDYAVDEAAKILSRDPGITIGRTRLFTFMGEIGWLYRHGARNRWHAYQTAVESGRLVERVSAAFLNQRTGEMEVPAPTIRVTAKGLQALRDALLKESAA